MTALRPRKQVKTYKKLKLNGGFFNIDETQKQCASIRHMLPLTKQQTG